MDDCVISLLIHSNGPSLSILKPVKSNYDFLIHFTPIFYLLSCEKAGARFPVVVQFPKNTQFFELT